VIGVVHELGTAQTTNGGKLKFPFTIKDLSIDYMQICFRFLVFSDVPFRSRICPNPEAWAVELAAAVASQVDHNLTAAVILHPSAAHNNLNLSYCPKSPFSLLPNYYLSLLHCHRLATVLISVMQNVVSHKSLISVMQNVEKQNGESCERELRSGIEAGGSEFRLIGRDLELAGIFNLRSMLSGTF
ncbi:hypothetical protein A2U01_0003499, partial [Trifolium medium]|nr:hypothetical protein [Trifolium medium]